MIQQKTTMPEFKIFCGNCLDLLKDIPDGTIDALITDPPYFLGFTNNGQKADFSNLEIARPFWRDFYSEVKRVLNPRRGCFYQFECWRSHAFFMPLMNEILGVRNTLVWDKGNGPGNFYNFQTELILFWTNDSRWKARENGQCVIRMNGFSDMNTAKDEGEKIHYSQKPKRIMRRLILDSTEPGWVVCDPFMGSGTTGVVALENGRRFIGFELQRKFYEAAEKRLKEVKTD